MSTAVAERPPLNLTDAEEWCYISPDQDIKRAYLSYVAQARSSIFLLIFGFHISELTDMLIAKHAAGLTVGCIFDHSQAQGQAEAREILRLLLAGVPLLIGTSWEAGQLIHTKVTVIDSEWVEEGSWNYSESATKQRNTARFTRSAELAHFYLEEYDKQRAYILNHETIFQPKREIAPPAALAEDVGRDAELDPKPDAGQVHRKDLAAPWLDNPPIQPDPAQTNPAPKPRVRTRKVRV